MKKSSPQQTLMLQHNCTWSVAHEALMRAKMELGYHYTLKLKSLQPEIRKSVLQSASDWIVTAGKAQPRQPQAGGGKPCRSEFRHQQVALGLRDSNGSNDSNDSNGSNSSSSSIIITTRPIGLKFHSLIDANLIAAGRSPASSPVRAVQQH